MIGGDATTYDLEVDDWMDIDPLEIDIVPDGYVILDGPERMTTINGETIYYREGTYMQRYDDGDFYADWSLTYFYQDPEHPEQYLYYEQDPPETAIHNLTHIMTR